MPNDETEEEEVARLEVEEFRRVPPKRLSDLDFDVTKIKFHINGLAGLSPRVRTLVANIIALSSWADHTRSLIPTLLMESDHVTIAAMFGAIRSAGVARAALHAAAGRKLPEEDVELLKQVLRFTSPAEKLRNRFAHGLWASSPEMPNCLILVDPAHMHLIQAMRESHTVSLETVQEEMTEDGATRFTFDKPLEIHTDIFKDWARTSLVYDVPSLTSVNYQVVHTYEILEAFVVAIRRGGEGEKARRRISEILRSEAGR